MLVCQLTPAPLRSPPSRRKGERDIRLGYLENDGGGKGHPLVTAENKLRTIIERENMLSRCARRAQQHIRLHEVTRIQWRRLALEF